MTETVGIGREMRILGKNEAVKILIGRHTLKAYEGTFTKKGSDAEVKLIGANSMSSAAKKAEDEAGTSGLELVKLELTDKVIL